MASETNSAARLYQAFRGRQQGPGGTRNIRPKLTSGAKPETSTDSSVVSTVWRGVRSLSHNWSANRRVRGMNRLSLSRADTRCWPTDEMRFLLRSPQPVIPSGRSQSPQETLSGGLS